jgi:hypothetical protein
MEERESLVRNGGLLLAVLVTLAIATGLTQAQSPDGEVNTQAAVGTAFTYQGRLTDNGNPANGEYDFEFKLYDDASTQVGGPITVEDKTVADGLFTVELDFGGAAFHGEARYLEIGVRPGDSSGDFTPLSPRQELTAVPYALHALEAPWSGLTGVPPELADGDDDTGEDWSLTGNAGTVPGSHFLGTTDDQALELRVNSERTLRLEPHTTSPNVVGGYSGNSVDAGVYGGTIGGGGETGQANSVTDHYGTVGGGVGNVASGVGAFVGGGGYDGTLMQGNEASGNASSIGGGRGNTASGDAATVGGGTINSAQGGGATIGGGAVNLVSGSSATVGGGVANQATDNIATVGGGSGNVASAYAATVPGGAGALADHHGEMAYASGSFADRGDAEASLYVMRRQDTMPAGTWYNLYLDGSGALITVASGRTMTFEILVVGRSDASESAGYRIRGVIENDGGTMGHVSTVFTLFEDDANWAAQTVPDAANEALRILVMGNGETIRWVASVRTAEVAW